MQRVSSMMASVAVRGTREHCEYSKNRVGTHGPFLCLINSAGGCGVLEVYILGFDFLFVTLSYDSAVAIWKLI